MEKIKLFAILMLFVFALKQNAFSEKQEYLFNENDTLIKDISFYGNIYHHHHDFFNKAFSFQGIEAGVVFNNTVLLGVFGSSFVSNLEVSLSNQKRYFSMKQAGLIFGKIYDSNKFLHTGFLISMGIMSIKGDSVSFGAFSSDKRMIDKEAFLISPQLFAEMNIFKWMKIRSGLAYTFYSIEDQTIIKKDDLQNISFTFGFVFGKF
jgi:hypothetical protein